MNSFFDDISCGLLRLGIRNFISDGLVEVLFDGGDGGRGSFFLEKMFKIGVASNSFFLSNLKFLELFVGCDSGFD